MKRAIVLSGGGAKGAYQIGVWKALKKLHIKYDIVTGTSVGALNGALMTQKSYWKARNLWKKMDYSILFNKKELKDLDKNKETNLVKMYLKNIINGGIDITNLEKLVKRNLDIKKFKNSNIQFGMITVNSKTFKPKIIKKGEVDINKLCDYLIASAACFPVFPKKQIEKKQFIDGGYYDNLPINLAIELGAQEIIAVDLKAVGKIQKIKDKTMPITYISPKNKIGNFLMFEQKYAKKAMKFGYNDTMKLWNQLEGNLFTFYQGEIKKISKKYGKKMIQEVKELFPNQKEIEELSNITNYKKILSNNEKNREKIILEIVEFLGHIYQLEEETIYCYRSFNHQLKKNLHKIEKRKKLEFKKKKQFLSIDRIHDFYIKLEKAKKNPKVKKKLYAYIVAFPKEFLASLYLNAIERN